MSEIKKTIIKTTADEIVVEVEANSLAEFMDNETKLRIEELDEVGPFGPKQAMPFITFKQALPILIVLALCLVAHVWARVTIGM